MKEPRNGCYQFDQVEVDLGTMRLKVASQIRQLEPKSFRLLGFLVENAGRILSKDEIMAAIWPDVSVSENSLTHAMTQIRKALGDDPKAPRYVETIPTVGYRFIAEVTMAQSAAGPVPRTGPRFIAPAILVTAAALVIAGVWWVVAGFDNRWTMPARVSKLTYFPGDETDPAFSPDGRLIAFAWNGASPTRDIYVMPMGSDHPVQITADKANAISPAWSPDGKQIAYMRLDGVSKASLVVVPAGGGSGRVIREVHLIDDFFRAIRPLLTWTPDGTGIVYATQDDALERASLYLTDLDGKSRRKWTESSETSTGTACPSFSPDGKMFAYTEVFGPYQTRLFAGPVATGIALGSATPVTDPVHSLITSPVW
jgi:DNA-binding winged helix-turn-helix (wHTH) protein